MFGWFWRRWNDQGRFTLLIYMKSGNVVRCDRVNSFEWSTRSLSINQENGGHSVLVKTLELAQIEAVVRVD